MIDPSIEVGALMGLIGFFATVIWGGIRWYIGRRIDQMDEYEHRIESLERAPTILSHDLDKAVQQMRTEMTNGFSTLNTQLGSVHKRLDGVYENLLKH